MQKLKTLLPAVVAGLLMIFADSSLAGSFLIAVICYFFCMTWIKSTMLENEVLTEIALYKEHKKELDAFFSSMEAIRGCYKSTICYSLMALLMMSAALVSTVIVGAARMTVIAQYILAGSGVIGQIAVLGKLAVGRSRFMRRWKEVAPKRPEQLLN